MFSSGHDFPILRQLDVVGGEVFMNDTCPVCFSHSRTRLIHQYLTREVEIAHRRCKLRVLHFAPEHGITLLLTANPNISYIAADINPQRYDHFPNVQRVDITSLPFESDHFDLVICNHVLEHVPNDRQAMKELLRVLKPRGRAILQVPIAHRLKETIEDPSVMDPKERERRFGQSDHVRIYAADYTGRMAEVGMSVEVFSPAEHWGGSVIEQFRLNPREKIFVGKKEL
jgi:SAM-dependent methyltransferase